MEAHPPSPGAAEIELSDEEDEMLLCSMASAPRGNVSRSFDISSENGKVFIFFFFPFFSLKLKKIFSAWW